MPLDPNEPPPLNPKNLRAPLQEHFDNTNTDSNGKTVTQATNQDGQTVAGASTGGATNTDSSKPTVTVSGDVTGSVQVFPGTVLGEALIKVTPDLSKFDFTGFDGKAVDVNKKVEGDMSVTAKSKDSGNTQGTKPPQQSGQQQAGS